MSSADLSSLPIKSNSSSSPTLRPRKASKTSTDSMSTVTFSPGNITTLSKMLMIAVSLSNLSSSAWKISISSRSSFPSTNSSSISKSSPIMASTSPNKISSFSSMSYPMKHKPKNSSKSLKFGKMPGSILKWWMNLKNRNCIHTWSWKTQKSIGKNSKASLSLLIVMKNQNSTLKVW